MASTYCGREKYHPTKHSRILTRETETFWHKMGNCSVCPSVLAQIPVTIAVFVYQLLPSRLPSCGSSLSLSTC